MKKLRVFQTVKRKRIVPGFSLKSLGTVLLLFFFLPYLLAFLFGNVQEAKDPSAERAASRLEESRIYVYNTTSLGKERIPLETYVADKLSRTMDTGYEMEALKAQAVLIRSALLSEQMPEEMSYNRTTNKSTETWNFNEDIKIEDEEYGSGPVTERIIQAVAESAGIYLSCQGKPVKGPYFTVSNGATRDGEELGLSEYPYLKRVLCDRDFLSPDYSETVSFYEAEFEKIWQQCDKYRITEEEILQNEKVRVEKEELSSTIYRDSAGYVLFMERGGEFVSGEEIRMNFYLPSASFHLEKEEKEVRFSVRGKGHGLGMSQFAANEMAKQGDDYVAILNYFFQDTTISKFE